MTAIILDTETTGFEEPMEVIELAWGRWPRLSNSPGVDNFYHERFYPKGTLEWGAISTHHILPADLIGCRDAALAPNSLPEDVSYIIGHNVDFDWKALGCPPVKRICTLALARSLYPEMDSHRLGSMMYRLFGMTEETRERVKKAHSAMDDVLMTGMILGAMMPGVTDLVALWNMSEEARVPKTMTFGKFRGQPISAVDRGYMSWYRRQPDPDPYLLEAFKRNGL